MTEYIVTFQSRYYPLEGTRRKRFCAPNKQYIRNNWHATSTQMNIEL